MLKAIKFESKISIKNVPIQWIPRFELYYPDLPQFPIVYVHTIVNGIRVYGFPIATSFKVKEDENYDVEIVFLSNIDLDKKPRLKSVIIKELEERFGISEKINIQNIVEGCKGNKSYEVFFRRLWKYISKIYGEYLPYGRYYEEVFSIVRFVSAWNPKTGRQSEMRMLYNFMSIFGEQVKIQGKWNYLEFFLLPTYQEIISKKFSDFPKFKKLFVSIKKIWKICFTEKSVLDKKMKIQVMPKKWPEAKDNFIKEISYPLFVKKKISLIERNNIERLIDAFNRHSWRAAFFIWSIMSIFEKDYYSWDKDFFIKFYDAKCGVGVSEKVVACFLQQAFKKDEITPIDTWVESFYRFPLAINSQKDFFKKFDKLGKIERAIWFSCQAKKTNIKAFFNILWCIRYGDTGNNELRGANPISCYECELMSACLGFDKIKELKVLIVNRDKVKTEELKTKKGKVKGRVILSKRVIEKAEKNNCHFICLVEDDVPKKIFKKKSKRWKLFDEFSGYILINQKLKIKQDIVTVKQFIASLPSFF